MNGMHNPAENPSMPIIGPRMPPFDACSSTSPTIGNVDEKVTTGNVSAIKNSPPTLPDFALSWVALIINTGSDISKAPNKDKPRPARNRKKKRLKIQLLDSFRNPVVWSTADTIIPSVVKMSITNTEKMIVLCTPSFIDLLLKVRWLIVIGTKAYT